MKVLKLCRIPTFQKLSKSLKFPFKLDGFCVQTQAQFDLSVHLLRFLQKMISESTLGRATSHKVSYFPSCMGTLFALL